MSPTGPDKQRLLDAVRERIEQDLVSLVRRHEDVQAGAVHEESRAEHTKDTRATEQSYLARGLAERVEDLRRTADALERLAPRDFGPHDPIAATALVTLSDADEGNPEPETWFVVPGAGGVDLTLAARRVRTVTPVSPLGRALLGLCVGEEGVVRTPKGQRRFEIVDVR